MASKRTHDVVATIGTYKDRDGNEKKRYINIGSAFTDDESRISIKLDAFPASKEWSGWISLYPIKDKADSPRQSPERNHPADRGGEKTDDIPF